MSDQEHDTYSYIKTNAKKPSNLCRVMVKKRDVEVSPSTSLNLRSYKEQSHV
jgi:hypothetical protein